MRTPRSRAVTALLGSPKESPLTRQQNRKRATNPLAMTQNVIHHCVFDAYYVRLAHKMADTPPVYKRKSDA